MAIIREANEADLDSICALGEEVNSIHHEAFPGHFAGPGAPDRDRAHWRSSIDREDSTSFVADEDTAILGFVTTIVTTQSHPLLQPVIFGHVGTVCVAASARARGVGATLMRQAEAWCKQRGASELRLNVWAFNEPALAMYRGLGYELRSHSFAKALNDDA